MEIGTSFFPNRSRYYYSRGSLSSDAACFETFPLILRFPFLTLNLKTKTRKILKTPFASTRLFFIFA